MEAHLLKANREIAKVVPPRSNPCVIYFKRPAIDVDDILICYFTRYSFLVSDRFGLRSEKLLFCKPCEICFFIRISKEIMQKIKEVGVVSRRSLAKSAHKIQYLCGCVLFA